MSMTAGLLSRSPEEGARLLALSFLDQAAEARPRLADPGDSEALHDFRVGLRRLRSCLRAYDAQLADSIPKKLAKRLKRLAGSTGPGRDTEVQIEWLRARSPHLSSYHRAGLTWLLAHLEERKQEAYGEMQDEVADEFDKVEEDLRARLSVYRVEIHLDPKEDRPTLAEATARILHHQVAQLEQHLAKTADADDETEAHQARISAKRVRYLLEPLVDEIPGAPPIVKRFKALQDLLGELHDAHVLEARLSKVIEKAAAERSRKILGLSLAAAPDDSLLRAERRRAHESGVIALARMNRVRRDRLFAVLNGEWLDGKASDFLREVEGLGERMIATAAPASQ
ncbi:MAG: metal-binding protein [Acidobacteria bacterium]|nr:MAG: metal-binding protein [Acidobacteriota bacterium]